LYRGNCIANVWITVDTRVDLVHFGAISRGRFRLGLGLRLMSAVLAHDRVGTTPTTSARSDLLRSTRIRCVRVALHRRLRRCFLASRVLWLLVLLVRWC